MAGCDCYYVMFVCKVNFNKNQESGIPGKLQVVGWSPLKLTFSPWGEASDRLARGKLQQSDFCQGPIVPADGKV